MAATADQLDFGFSAPQTLPQAGDTPAAKARKSATAKPRKTTRVASPGSVPVEPVETRAGDATDPEALARVLEQHPDYRVLRRLKPCLDFGPVPPIESAGTCTTVLILDTETTGLDAAREQIIELALLRVQVDNATGLPCGAVQVYDGLQDPGKPISAEVQALTGISDAMVRGQQLDEARIVELLQGVDLVIAHNAGFDRPFVEARLPAFAQVAWACSFADIDWKAAGLSSAKLEMLAASHGWFYDAHRAEMDCHALLAVLAKPLPGADSTGLARLLQAGRSGATAFRLQATGAPFEAKDVLKTRGYRWNAEQRVWATRLDDEAALQVECDWLRAEVYGGRHARVLVEKLSPQVKYSARSGDVSQLTL